MQHTNKSSAHKQKGTTTVSVASLEGFREAAWRQHLSLCWKRKNERPAVLRKRKVCMPGGSWKRCPINKDWMQMSGLETDWRMRFRNTGASLGQRRLFEPDDRRPRGSSTQDDHVQASRETSEALDLTKKKTTTSMLFFFKGETLQLCLQLPSAMTHDWKMSRHLLLILLLILAL